MSPQQCQSGHVFFSLWSHLFLRQVTLAFFVAFCVDFVLNFIDFSFIRVTLEFSSSFLAIVVFAFHFHLRTISILLLLCSDIYWCEEVLKGCFEQTLMALPVDDGWYRIFETI